MFSQFKDRVARRNKGNGQTTCQHNRLSKPRTNTNSKSASPVITSDIPFPDSPRYADVSAKSRQQIKEVISPTIEEAGIASWSEPGMFDTEAAVEGRGRRSTAVSRSNSRAHSRSGSALRSFVRSRRNSLANLKNVPGSRVSLSSNTQPDIEAAIRLLQEVKRNASPEELAALREALEGPNESSAATLDLEYDRSSPEISGALTRRKSLVQTPGVATRTALPEGKRRTWSSWKAPPLRPSDEAKWRAPKQGPSPLDRLRALDLADSTQAQTPGENYSPFLGYRPGTLMVVNGDPSPAMSTADLNPTDQANAKIDYFSANELIPAPSATRGEQRPVRPRSVSVYGTRDSTIRSVPMSPGEEKIAITYIKPEVKYKKRPQSIVVSTRMPQQSADTLAKDYQSYIPYSPFENQMVIQNTWQDQEPTTDELFIEDLEPQLRSSNSMELSATITDVAELSPPSTATSIHSIETPKNRHLRPSPRTSDSGYSSIGSSSGGSLRVANNDEHQQVPRALRVFIPPSGPPHGRYSANRRQTMSFELPTDADLPAHFERSLLSTVPRHAHGRTLSLDIPHNVAELPSMDVVLSPSTPQSATSRPFEKPLPRQMRRLQKRRPSQPQLPVVQSALPNREVIPEVPDDVQDKFSRRLSVTPGMECLTHTYPSKDHTTAAESVTSFGLDEPVVSPISLEPDYTPARPARNRRLSMSLFWRKSTTDKNGDEGEEIPSPKVLDFGTIAVSLGASPYDPSMFGSFQPKEVVEHPTHPHQLGQARSHSRSRSAMSMSSDTAAEYARMRSKDRALPEPEMVEMPQHRKARRKPKMEIGEAKQLRRRTQTFHTDDAPPMPSIDHTKYASPLSARPRLENVEANQSRIRVSSRPQSPLRPNHTRPPSAHRNVDWEHSINWEQHALQWKQRRQSIGDSLRPRPKVEAQENVAPAPRARPMSYTPQELTTFGRYGGGLEYEHEGHGQIGGSAGTRQLHSYTMPKSMYYKQSYGVDLSDVPIFVQRQQQ